MPVRDVRRFSHERVERKPSLQTKKKKIALLKRIGVYALGIVFIGSLAYFLLFVYKYTTVSVVGNQEVSTAQIQSVVTPYIVKDWYRSFFSNPITINTENIISDIKSSSYLIDEVNIQRNYFSFVGPTLSIIIKERRGSGYWCDVEEKECVLIDRTGFAFKRAEDTDSKNDTIPDIFAPTTDPVFGIPKDVALEISTSSNNGAEATSSAIKIIDSTVNSPFAAHPEYVVYKKDIPKLGTMFERNPQAFGKLSDVSVRLVQIIGTDEVRDEVSQISYLALNQYLFKTKQGRMIKLDVSDDIEKQMLRLKKVWEDTQVQQSQYVDLRFGNKIFYKPAPVLTNPEPKIE